MDGGGDAKELLESNRVLSVTVTDDEIVISPVPLIMVQTINKHLPVLVVCPLSRYKVVIFHRFLQLAKMCKKIGSTPQNHLILVVWVGRAP